MLYDTAGDSLEDEFWAVGVARPYEADAEACECGAVA